MVLKPHDIYVLLKLVAKGSGTWGYNQLAVELGMSPSEVHAAVKRTLKAGLVVQDNQGIRPNITTLGEFLRHGIRYVFVPDRGEMTRGVPTAHAAPVLADLIVNDGEPPPVWPDIDGTVRGFSFSPLHKSAPKAVQQDATFYELLALVDAIRGGRARESALAVNELERRLSGYVSPPSKH